MKLLVISNMYPDSAHPSYGIFVKKFCDQLDRIGIDYDKSVMLKSDSGTGKIAGYAKFYLKSLYKLLFSGYDVAYVHYASHSGIPVLISHKLRKKTIYTNVHGSDIVPENSKQQKMQKYTAELLQISDKIIVPSEYFKNYMVQKYGLPREMICVYPSAGIDGRVFHPLTPERKKALKKEYGLDSEFPVFGMAGRISAGKGWDTFVEAVSRLQDDHVKANYMLVGDGPEKQKLDCMIEKMGLTGCIHRNGMLSQEKLAEFFGMIDFLVFPTRRQGESLGLVAIEAMACATPVISSAYAAPNEYIKEDYNGYKFKVCDSGELAEKMKKACDIYGSSSLDSLKAGALNTAGSYYEENIIEDLKNIIADR